jgi:hypothetical protein
VKFTLIDYSEQYFKGGLPARRQGKFIQVRSGGAEYLVLSPGELCFYHANIAERFFVSMGLAGSYNRKRDHYRVKSPAWAIVGGGAWEADETRRQLSLSGASMAYGAFDPEGLKQRIESAGAFQGYGIRVGG